MPLTCELVTDFDALASYASDWERLLSGGDRQEIFDTFAWARAWWQAHGHRVGLTTAIVREGARVVAIWPLVRDGSTLRFLGYVGGDYKDVLCERGREAEAVSTAIEALFRTAGWDQALLNNVPYRSRLAPAVAALPAALRCHTESAVLTACPTVRLDGPDRDQILHDILRKESLRRHEKKLAKLGTLTFRHLTDRAEIAQHLPRFFEQHVQRWALTNQRSVFLEESPKALYTALVEELDPELSLRFGAVELDGRPVAYHFGFQHAGKFVWYKPTFDVDYWDCGPGEVLLAFLFRYVRDAGLTEFDFTVGDESFKSRFATHEEQNLQIRLFRPGVRGWARRRLHHAKAGFMARAPELFEMVRGWNEQVALNGLRQAAREALGTGWRRAFESETTVVYEVPAGTELTAGAGGAPCVEPLTLARLINLVARTPGLMAQADIGRARARLKAGDVPWHGHAGDRTVCIAWSKRGTSIGPLSTGRQATLALAGESVVIDDWWLAGGVDDSQLSQTLRRLAHAAAPEGEPVRVLCAEPLVRLRQALERLGAQPVARFRYRRFWDRVVDAVEADALG